MNTETGNVDLPGPEHRSFLLWLKALGINTKKDPDPRYVRAAQAIYVNKVELETVAACAAPGWEEKEWSRLVALLLEAYLSPGNPGQN